MKAVIFPKNGPVDAPDALIDVERPKPEPTGRDLLIRVKAVSVNPVDYKTRIGGWDSATGGTGILGWDAAGVVEAAGPEATFFSAGDEVYYAGAVERAGSNAEFQLVDERVVGPKPLTISFAEAAAMPLTTLTAWEMLFDRLNISEGGGGGDTILIVGAAGGVGSIAVQLARQLTSLRVIATASREETKEWALKLGAHAVIDHSKPLTSEFKALGLDDPKYVLIANGADVQFAEAANVVAPQGKLGVIVPLPPIDTKPLFLKSISVNWEFMFTRHLYNTENLKEQNRILTAASKLIDEGRLRSTASENFGRICAANLIRAHRLLESGRAKGKIVLEGF